MSHPSQSPSVLGKGGRAASLMAFLVLLEPFSTCASSSFLPPCPLLSVVGISLWASTWPTIGLSEVPATLSQGLEAVDQV